MEEGTKATVEERLLQLADLHDRGMLTREEFEKREARLLEEPPAGTSPSAPQLPSQIGAYRVRELIGQGGMGAVCRARHESDGFARRQGGLVRTMAIKVSSAAPGCDAVRPDQPATGDRSYRALSLTTKTTRPACPRGITPSGQLGPCRASGCESSTTTKRWPAGSPSDR